MFHENTDPAPHRPKPSVCLIGAGTVGRAILGEFLRNRFDVTLVDSSEPALALASHEMQHAIAGVQVLRSRPTLNDLPAIRFSFDGEASEDGKALEPALVLESVSENLSLKQSLFRDLARALPADTILASNTSNLRINDVFAALGGESRCCGLHFFMPVEQRPLAEFIATEFTSPATKATCEAVVRALGKAMLVAKDSPGFVVNRLLVPYLNQSMLMLERGVQAEQLAEAAQRFGMPLSPLKLMDTIGIRTAFDSGRIFWQSFPERLDPAPILPGMIKAKRLGSSTGGGFFDSSVGEVGVGSNGTLLHPDAAKVIAKYQRESQTWDTDELSQLISIPMLIEAAEVLATGVVEDLESIELAMAGGLGYQSQRGFFDYFDNLGRDQIIRQLDHHGSTFRGLRASSLFREALQECDSPRAAIQHYVKSYRSES